jgi:glycosyltransferase involved in cell wall biosynthesis
LGDFSKIKSKGRSNLDLSIVSPCYNESDNLVELVERTEKAVKDFSLTISYEHIIIDNASSDNSLEILSKLKLKFPQVRVLYNSENIGVFSSIQRAMRKSKGVWLIPFLTSDMQDPPEVITKFLAVQKETNCDAVFGVRKKRQESFFLLLMRKLFYLCLRQFITGKKYVSGTSEFCLIKKDLALGVIEVEDPNPFLRIYLSKLTEKVEYVNFSMVERRKGKSSGNIFTLVDDALNAFSIIIPSVFSRIMVVIFPIYGIVFFVFLISFLYSVINPTLYMIPILNFFILLFMSIIYLQLFIGHYIFILHSQIRKKPTIQTIEL